MSTIVTVDSSRTYSISPPPPSCTTSSSRSPSPISSTSSTSSSTSFYQTSSATSSTDTSATSSTDSLDTVKSSASVSTVKLFPFSSSSSPHASKVVASSSSDSITIPISRTPTPPQTTEPSPSLSQDTSTQPSQRQTKPKFKLPNYYVPPAKLVHPAVTVAVSPPSPPPQQPLPQPKSLLQSAAFNTTPSTAKPPLLRKKSGELIKSSLKLPALLQRSISSPHISTDGEVGGIVSPRKSVRFASRLINVRMFDGCDTPASVSSAGSPLDSPDEDEEDYFYANRNRAPKFGSGFATDAFDLSAPAYIDDFEFSKFTNRTTNFDWDFNVAQPKEEIKQYRLTSHNIPSTGNHLYSTTSQSPSPSPSPDSSKVWMTSAYLLKVNNKTFLCGWLNVVNIAFTKEINLKLTIDNWATSIIVGGITKYQKSLDPNLDQFKFMLDLESFNIVDEKTIELCLEYHTNGQTFWGNNGQQNYKFHIERKVNRQVPVQQQQQQQSQQSQIPPQQRPSSSSGSRSKVKSKSANALNSSGYEEICNKLLNHKSTLALNFTNDEFSFRPSLKKSFSTSDVTSATGDSNSFVSGKYSNRQRQKQGGHMTGGADNAGSGIKDMTYADILQKYCFAGTTPTTATTSTEDATTSNATSMSAAVASTPRSSGSATAISAGLVASAPASAHSSPMLGSHSPVSNTVTTTHNPTSIFI
ncbi:GAC1 [Candida theae]|uniref:GAC1 n=1 Tax=Candida theae TaxID=1198502 RepID=A0AAD5BCY6_9ASCO|nr:GAC1 [Candida theae]KAI5956036.1 GAC1 [Candida theae]